MEKIYFSLKEKMYYIKLKNKLLKNSEQFLTLSSRQTDQTIKYKILMANACMVNNLIKYIATHAPRQVAKHDKYDKNEI